MRTVPPSRWRGSWWPIPVDAKSELATWLYLHNDECYVIALRLTVREVGNFS